MPDWKPEIRRRLASLQLSPTREAAIVEELAQHLDDCYAESLSGGATEAEATRAALAELSESELLARELRRVERQAAPEPIILGTNKRTKMIADLWQDLRFGVRMLLKQPGFTLIAVLTLALGIGTNTAIFSVLHGVLLKALPLPEPERLMFVYEDSAEMRQMSVAYLNLRDWQQQQTVFANLAGYSLRSATLTGAGEPERMAGRNVTANFLATLGVPLTLGRSFTEAEDQAGGARVVIISHKVWRRHFNSDPNVIGQSTQLSGDSYTIVGVLPAGFDFYGRDNPNNDFLLPLGQMADRDFMRDRGAHPGIWAIGRLQAGVTMAQARAEMKTLATRLAREHPQEGATHSIAMRPLLDDYVGEVGQTLWMIQITAGLVLLIACANVANLLLARAATRQKEIAVRMAVGAGRWRVVRQLLTEALWLALAGGILGRLFAWWGVKLLTTLYPDSLPRLHEVALDGRVLVFTALLTLLTGILFGLAPALQTAQADVYAVLKNGARPSTGGSQRLRGALVSAEIALSLLVLIGAGLLWQSYRRVLQVDPGFDARNVLTMQVGLPEAKYPTAEQKLAFHEATSRRVAALPGVQHVSVTNGFPLSAAIVMGYTVEGQAPSTGDGQSVIVQSVSADYLQVFGIGLLAGRTFNAQDTATTPAVVVVDEAFARQHFPARPLSDVLGRRVQVGGDNLPWRTIVGIVRNIRHYGRETEGRAEIYRLWSQMGPGWVAKRMSEMHIVVKTAADPATLIAPIKRAVRSIDKDQPLDRVRTLASYLDESVATRRFTWQLLGLFAVLALLLACVGIAGVMAYAVTQRRHEIGIRMALGAQAGDVLRLVLRQGMTPALLGVMLGLGAAVALTRWLKTLLFGIAPNDPLTFAVLTLLLLGLALLACWIPARRATRVDPLMALRHE